jgi:hypothetical protein
MSSARASTDGGIVSPSALAVFRFSTSSYLVGSSTGRSAGLRALEDPGRQAARAAHDLFEIWGVGHQAARLGLIPEREHCRDPMLERHVRQDLPLLAQVGRLVDGNCADPLSAHRLEELVEQLRPLPGACGVWMTGIRTR